MNSVVTGSAKFKMPSDKCMCAWQSLLNGKGTKRDLQLVLGNVTKAKSMALLMRTIVAAHVQAQLKPCPSSHERRVPKLLSQCDVMLGQHRTYGCSMCLKHKVHALHNAVSTEWHRWIIKQLMYGCSAQLCSFCPCNSGFVMCVTFCQGFC